MCNVGRLGVLNSRNEDDIFVLVMNYWKSGVAVVKARRRVI